MAGLLVIKCRECGVDCDFEAYGESVEAIIEACAAHGRQEHGMRSFTPALYTRMRRLMHTADDAAPVVVSDRAAT